MRTRIIGVAGLFDALLVWVHEVMSCGLHAEASLTLWTASALGIVATWMIFD